VANKKFTFTQEDLDNMILEALNKETTMAKNKQPNAIQSLLAKAKLGKKE